jgi:hypothetical protein
MIIIFFCSLLKFRGTGGGVDGLRRSSYVFLGGKALFHSLFGKILVALLCIHISHWQKGPISGWNMRGTSTFHVG